MNMILSTVLQEKQRIDYMLARYQETLSELPKGTISEKLINGNTYYYLKYRDGKKVISKYVVKDNIQEVKEQIEKRRHIEAMIKSLTEEQRHCNEKIFGGKSMNFISRKQCNRIRAKTDPAKSLSGLWFWILHNNK